MVNNKQARRKQKSVRWIITATIWTFFLATGLAFVTRFLVQSINSTFLSFLILFLIIFMGVLFDTIGTAVTAADEKPFHAKASKKIYGAKKGIYLVKNAEKVANFCNDVIGDISGVISGVIGAIIIINLVLVSPGLNELYLNIVLAGLIAAFTVGGKAIGKYLAINFSTEVVLLTAQLLTSLGRVFFWGKSTQRAKRS